MLQPTRGWSVQSPSLPVEIISRTQVANPLLMIDELEKESTSTSNGLLSDALLSFLEPENAQCYFDEGLMSSVDLTWFGWVAACNDAEPIPEPVKSRFRKVSVGLPWPEHGPLIANAVPEGFAVFALPEQPIGAACAPATPWSVSTRNSSAAHGSPPCFPAWPSVSAWPAPWPWRYPRSG